MFDHGILKEDSARLHGSQWVKSMIIKQLVAAISKACILLTLSGII